MISGLLSTLNEEAHEDIMTEELMGCNNDGSSSQDSGGSGGGTSSVISGGGGGRNRKDADCVYLKHQGRRFTVLNIALKNDDTLYI
jgi:hypothetical protein